MQNLAGNNLIFLLIMIFWVIPWKGYALWTTVKNNNKIWFIVLLIVNTFGLLEVIYVFGVAKKKWSDVGRAFKRLLSFKPKK
ncbi:MAG TPA: DUF5652 family protein [Candidatus Paceibacterota bacterium]|nr:DUF5652 family protein [Candidatus Paceibacterota bacterium]HPT17969.1 DUF5652 family protein [Candidatus Paceibacterota bacterium]